MRAAVLMLVLAVGGAAQAEETRSDRLIEKEAAGLSAAERNWPAWRGPHGTGVSSQTGVPLRWSADENITWKVPLAGEGNATPIVWEDRIFLTSASPDGAQRTLLCFDRRDGRVLWQRELTCRPNELTHETNPYGAASPTTDGERVYVWQGSAGIAAYDFEGVELWRRDVGTFTHIWGYAASPVLVGDAVIFSCGPGLRALLVALDKHTGQELWRRDLPEAQSKDEKQFYGSWATPVVRAAGGRQELLLGLPRELRAFDPRTGADLWKCRGLGDLVYMSPVFGDEIVVAMSGYHGPALASRAGGEGDVTETHRLWLHEERNPQRVGSGVVVGKHLYILNEPGVAWCIDVETGERRWEQRLAGRSWSSMVSIDGRIYALDMRGETLVIEPNPRECVVVAHNKLDGETTRASLAFSQGQVFVRSYRHLYCIGSRTPAPAASP